MVRNNSNITKLGTRKLQKGTSTCTLAIPKVVVDTLKWEPHDELDIDMVDNKYIIIRKAII